MHTFDTKIINLHAGPGSGKSTTSAGLFYLMKLAGYNVELVVEYAKELTYDKDFETLKNQKKIFKEQKKRLDRLLGTVEYIVTDSPILLSLVYLPLGYKELTAEEIRSEFESYNNINFFIRRVKKYNPIGRNQTLEEAEVLDGKIKGNLQSYPYQIVDGDENAPQKILEFIKSL